MPGLLRLLATWERIAREADAERRASGHDGIRLDARVPGTLVVVAMVLVFEEYVGDRDFFARHLGRFVPDVRYELASFAWWALGKLVGYLLVPLLVVRWLRLPSSVLNVASAGVVRHLRAYLLLYLAVLPLVIVASRTDAFQLTYPFYRQAGRSVYDFIAWELLYASSFVAIELFYRGFALGMLRRSLGPYAIFVMMVPYCTIHFGKPAMECVGSIVAGVALGLLAMATRSIWGGVLIHVAVAWTMDVLSLFGR